MENFVSSDLFLVLGAGGLVFARTHAYAVLKAGLVMGVLLYPWAFLHLLNGSALNLSMLFVGLFGKLSPLGLLVALWMGGIKLGLRPYSRAVAFFLVFFGGVVFADALGFLPFSLAYPPFAWISLALWNVLAYRVHRVLGILFALVLSFQLWHPAPAPYTMFMDIYLWLGALWSLLVCFYCRAKHPCVPKPTSLKLQG
ncbi:hypothetical protein [Helicobacter salomonis]|uniref:hypothetical protein n=1 Tax=Helicobacter salomonis TaxID=56878 RepID=UPI000CF06B26|nr:hypothetical protein [Helicobacter salomonis]